MYYDTVIPDTAQGRFYTFFKAKIPLVTGWSIHDDMAVDYHIVFKCVAGYGTYYLELNDIDDAYKLWWKVWQSWDEVTHAGDTLLANAGPTYISRKADQSLRLYISSRRVILGDRTQGKGFYAGYLTKLANDENPFLVCLGGPTTESSSLVYQPLMAYSCLWRIAEDHLGNLNQKCRPDWLIYSTTTMYLHRITPMGRVIIMPSLVVKDINDQARAYGFLENVAQLGVKTGVVNGDIIYDESDEPWLAYVAATNWYSAVIVKDE